MKAKAIIVISRMIIILLIFNFTINESYSQTLTNLYNANSVFKYFIEAPQSYNIYDTIKLRITDKDFFGQKRVEWLINYKDSAGSTIQTESVTGLYQSEKRIWLHPPRTNYFNILEKFPFPEIRAPLVLGNKWQNETRVVSGFGSLNGKKVISRYEIAGISDTSYCKTSKSKVFEVIANSEIENDDSNLSAKFLFLEDLGFINAIFLDNEEVLISFKLTNCP
jgi:hypothetical protein